MREQIRAVEDAGLEEWLFWNSESAYPSGCFWVLWSRTVRHQQPPPRPGATWCTGIYRDRSGWCFSSLRHFARVAPATTQGLTEIVQRELGASRQGVVIALHVDGDLQFFEAYGERGSTPEELLTTDALFAYPAMSEVLLSLMVEALDSAEIVDGDAPLYTYLPDLSPLLGQATLRQLISHSGGLDDAQRVEGETWERTLDRIDDRALVAEPGLFYSRSRHSFPLAARALTAALRRPFDELAATLILEPLGMTSSTFDVDEARIWGLVAGVERNDDATSPTRSVEAVDTLTGLPVLFTTAGDVVTLLSAWNDGQLGGRLPHEIASGKNPAVDRNESSATACGWTSTAG